MSGNTMGTCPSGGKWYTCTSQSPTFLGCCMSDPCNGVGCPSSDLRPAGMGTACGPDASSNDASYWPYVDCPNGGQWWTFISPSFQGCCDSNPSHGGCPSNQLHPAAFKYDSSAVSAATKLGTCSPSGWMVNVNAVATGSATVQSSSTPKITSPITSQTTNSQVSSPTPPSSPNATNNPTTTIISMLPAASATTSPTPSPKNNTPAIAGGAAGGVAFIILLTLAIIWTIRRRRNRKEAEAIEAMTIYPEPPKQGLIPFQDEDRNWRPAPDGSNTYEAYSPSRSPGAAKGPKSSPHLHQSPGPPAYSWGSNPLRLDLHEIHGAEVHEVGGGGGYAAELGESGRRPVGLRDDSRRERFGSGVSEMSGNGGGRSGHLSGESLLSVSEGGGGGGGERGSYTSWQNYSPRLN